MAKKYIEREQLAAYLYDRYELARGLSRAADISVQYAFNILRGNVYPSDKVLDKIGLKIVYEVKK